MTGNKMSAQSVGEPQSPFQIDEITMIQPPQAGTRQGLRGDIGTETTASDVIGCQAHPVDSNGLALMGVSERKAGLKVESQSPANRPFPEKSALPFDDSGKHRDSFRLFRQPLRAPWPSSNTPRQWYDAESSGESRPLSGRHRRPWPFRRQPDRLWPSLP